MIRGLDGRIVVGCSARGHHSNLWCGAGLACRSILQAWEGQEMAGECPDNSGCPLNLLVLGEG